MSNDVVSQQFQFPGRQIVQMDSVSDTVVSVTSDMQQQVVGPVSHNYVSTFHMPISNGQGRTVESMPSYSGFPNLMASKNQMVQMATKPGIVGFENSGIMLPNIGSQSSLLPSKRKAEVEEATSNSISQQPSMANKRTVQMGTLSHLPQSLQPTAVNRKSLHMQSKLGPANAQNTPMPNKKLMRNESISGKSGSQRVQTPKSRTAQVGSASKVRGESVVAVRSKMREKLAEALSVVSENQDKSSYADKNITEASSSHQVHADTSGSNTGAAMAQEEKCRATKEVLLSKESGSAGQSDSIQGSGSPGQSDSIQGLSAEVSNNGSLGNHVENFKETIFPQDDVSFSDNFFVKDELLQGNGLSWALDFDMGVVGVKEVPNGEKPKAQPKEANGVAREQERSSPENLALQIETELFKLYGGVNKKYKEKGRSLCFNLKDPSNPELRDRVVSGEIAPDRLCSMTAEELASKELSEWRTAKAEELAQMVVLPDTGFDRRRLVKKTHKGEYQVEMEEDTGDVMDVSSGTSTNNAKGKMEANASELDGVKDVRDIENQKNGSVNNDVPDSLVIPSDGTDFMQGIIVDDDEFKDADFLPPIISLDEFMESLDSEPPFENLQVDPAQSSPASNKEKSDVGNSSAVESEAGKDLGDAVSEKKADEPVAKHKIDVAVKPTKSPEVKKVSLSSSSPRMEHLWEGKIQLTMSSAITTFCVFKSGERTTTGGWPKSLEIKGRVRLEAFEKFIKDLPMSRSRAVMILHFALKDNEFQSDRDNLLEAVDSYVSDKRLGFAEPSAGAELYFCPPNDKMIDMLSSYLLKKPEEIANSSDNGLIGVVVWRKIHISSTISPNSASHNKHSSTKRQQQHFNSSSNVNVNLLSEVPVNRPTNVQSVPEDDDSDIPPGFGPPGGSRDDDDLPEFNFPGSVNPVITRQNVSRIGSFKGPGTQRPVDQMRELVLKYGQTGASSDNIKSGSWLGNKGSSVVGLGIEPWNDDDDDDIPEWRPNAPLQPQTGLPNHGFQHTLHPSYGSPQLNPAGIHYQTPVAGGGSTPVWHQGGRLVQPPPSQPSGGQYYRTRQQDGSRSRRL